MNEFVHSFFGVRRISLLLSVQSKKAIASQIAEDAVPGTVAFWPPVADS